VDFEERQLQSSIDFLRKYRIFNKWSPAQLNSVFLATNEKKFQRNHIVFQQGDTPNELFFIKSGEFEVFLKNFLHLNNF
jgi:CRP-like cAMP-binding protein